MTDVSKRRRRPKGTPAGGEFAREGGTDASDLAGGMGGTGYDEPMPPADAAPGDIARALAHAHDAMDASTFAYDFLLRDDEAPWERLEHGTIDDREWLDRHAEDAIFALETPLTSGGHWVLDVIAENSDPADARLSQLIAIQCGGDGRILKTVMRSRAVNDDTFRRYGPYAYARNPNYTPAQRLAAAHETPPLPFALRNRDRTMLEAMILHPSPGYRAFAIQTNLPAIAADTRLWETAVKDPERRVRDHIARVVGLPGGFAGGAGAHYGIISNDPDATLPPPDGTGLHTYRMIWDGDEDTPIRLEEGDPRPYDHAVFRTPDDGLDGNGFDAMECGRIAI